MDPAYLSTLVLIGSNLSSNQKVYMPPKDTIFQRYTRKFFKNGKLLEELEHADAGLVKGPVDKVPGRRRNIRL